VGTVGALGTAMAVGVGQLSASIGSQGTDSTAHQPTVAGRSTQAVPQRPREQDDDEHSPDDGQQQSASRNQQVPQGGAGLAVQGNGGPAQGQSSGS